MPRPGIKILSETLGNGPELKKGDRVRIRYDIQLNRGDFLTRDEEIILTVGDRNFVAGLRYGLENLCAGATRRFRASPHLCYRDLELPNVPKNAVLIFDIKHVEIVGDKTLEDHPKPLFASLWPIWISLAILMILVNTACISTNRIQDYTVSEAIICKIHGSRMKERIVPQTFGMRRTPWIAELRSAREERFPHAAEIYDTYACLPSRERYARIHVCSECTTARTIWVAENLPRSLHDAEYLRECDSLLRHFARSYVGGSDHR